MDCALNDGVKDFFLVGVMIGATTFTGHFGLYDPTGGAYSVGERGVSEMNQWPL